MFEHRDRNGSAKEKRRRRPQEKKEDRYKYGYRLVDHLIRIAADVRVLVVDHVEPVFKHVGGNPNGSS